MAWSGRLYLAVSNVGKEGMAMLVFGHVDGTLEC